ncbi:MAG: HNH endonuclease [Acholeplasmatales bacterium]|jgi:5-methylcytosine-specific restriction protein A|nr:HNH endonuclease [Acholeplasmataceae bacterium]MCK9288877.1 HNH endonuclease [Acholeplasmataceae bacterium]MCK9428157.1 HNH endonuclease [Acholeplasmataceae bacterium]MDY0115480.1 HNH endonuclease [Acholeplasmatales bacterium]
MEWIISANHNKYDHDKSFEDFGFIDWRQVASFSIGDTVYIYNTKPYSKLGYITKVEGINLSFSQIRDDSVYWKDKTLYEQSKNNKFVRLRLIKKIDSFNITLEDMMRHGLNGAPQGPVKINDELSNYIKSRIKQDESKDIMIEQVNEYLEGEEQTILVTKYERNQEARRKCLEHLGTSCRVCGFNFFEEYGEIGRDFIHVHHIIPISQIKKNYVIDPFKELVPVCPNCHAMLHRRNKDGNYPSVEELKALKINKK